MADQSLARLVSTSAQVAAVSARGRKIELLASLLSDLDPSEVGSAVTYLSAGLPQGTVGVGWASLQSLPPPAPESSLSIRDLDSALERIGRTSGPGSQAERRRLLSELFAKATAEEQRFLRQLLVGELRQGALEGVVVEAVAKAAGVPAAAVRRAAMLAGSLEKVAGLAFSGRETLAAVRLEVLRPIQPMLAHPATDVAAALAKTGRAVVEWKLDGARLQAHKQGHEVRAFTRNLADVTDRVPEVVEVVRRLSAASAVLDGEVIALRPDRRPHPFQVTMGRFGTEKEIAGMRSDLPLTAFFFDCLYMDGVDLLDQALAERLMALDASVPEQHRTPRRVVEDAATAQAFLDEALAAGHEGVMVKALAARYEAGRRGASWLKVKRAHTLDLVVLAVEWGHGRRAGLLSNLHLGARDPESGGFVMLGKTFKGLTDEMLRWQTERFLDLETHRDRWTVYVRPEQVVEVAFDGVQSSTRYLGGLALRFARVKGYRPDKGPEEADTVQTVRAILEGSTPSLLRVETKNAVR